MRPGRLWFLWMALALASSCDKGEATAESDEPPPASAPAEAAPGEAAPTEAAPAPQSSDCPPLRITIDGTPMTVGSVHAYTGVSETGEVYGEFVRASEAADETCDEILANTGVSRGGQPVRYVTAFESPRANLYDTLMVSGWSQTGIALDYREGADGTRTICVREASTFTGPGDHEYTVIGELTGPYCGNMQM